MDCNLLRLLEKPALVIRDTGYGLGVGCLGVGVRGLLIIMRLVRELCISGYSVQLRIKNVGLGFKG